MSRIWFYIFNCFQGGNRRHYRAKPVNIKLKNRRLLRKDTEIEEDQK